jgi:hypothetical protein
MHRAKTITKKFVAHTRSLGARHRRVRFRFLFRTWPIVNRESFQGPIFIAVALKFNALRVSGGLMRAREKEKRGKPSTFYCSSGILSLAHTTQPESVDLIWHSNKKAAGRVCESVKKGIELIKYLPAAPIFVLKVSAGCVC